MIRAQASTTRFATSHLSFFCALALIAPALVACGGADAQGGEFGDDTPPGDTSEPKGPSGSLGGGGGSSSGASGPKACASTAVEAKLAPVNLVFMVDRSGSMGDTAQKKSAKWDPVVAALKSFFADTTSSGLKATLQYFPQGDPEDSAYCSTGTYAKTAVPLTALPNATFTTSLSATTPSGDGTPGLPAIKGALSVAQATAAATKEKTVVVYVTDGDPNKCDSSGASVAAAAAGQAGTIPTYVIGVGSVATLDQIAAAGGTKKAFVVNLATPAQTKVDFVAAVQKIRGAAASCNVAIPKAPAGATLDYAKVNVAVTPAGKASDPVSQVKDCAGGAGWRYDNPTSPKEIILCPATCEIARGGAKVEVLLGCSTVTR